MKWFCLCLWFRESKLWVESCFIRCYWKELLWFCFCPSSCSLSLSKYSVSWTAQVPYQLWCFQGGGLHHACICLQLVNLNALEAVKPGPMTARINGYSWKFTSEALKITGSWGERNLYESFNVSNLKKDLRLRNFRLINRIWYWEDDRWPIKTEVHTTRTFPCNSMLFWRSIHISVPCFDSHALPTVSLWSENHSFSTLQLQKEHTSISAGISSNSSQSSNRLLQYSLMKYSNCLVRS